MRFMQCNHVGVLAPSSQSLSGLYREWNLEDILTELVALDGLAYNKITKKNGDSASRLLIVSRANYFLKKNRKRCDDFRIS